jgi:hypothetical protein
MMLLHQLVPLLSDTFRGDDDAVHSSCEQLHSLFGSPGFPELLCDCIVDTTVPAEIRIAAVVQFRLLVQELPGLASDWLTFFPRFSTSFPDDAQSHLEFLADAIAAAAGVDLLPPVAELLACPESVIPALLLLRALLDRSDVVCEMLQLDCALRPILESAFAAAASDGRPAVMHYFAGSFGPFLLGTQARAQTVAPVLDFCCHFLVDDLIALARTIFAVYKEDLPGGPFVQACFAYVDGAPSLAGLTEMYFALGEILPAPDFAESLPEILSRLFLPVFMFGDDDRRNFESDPQLFLEDAFPATSDPATPRAAATACLRGLEDAAGLCFQLGTEALGSDGWTNFGAMTLVAATSRRFSELDGAFCELMHSWLESDDLLAISTAIVFLSDFPEAIAPPFIFPGIVLARLAARVHPVVDFLCCCALGSLFAHPDAEIAIGDSAADSVQIVLEVARAFPLEKIAQTAPSFLHCAGAQSPELAHLLIEPFLELFEQAMSDSDTDVRRNAGEFLRTISNVLEFVSDPGVIDHVLQRVAGFHSDDFSEDVLPLLRSCARFAPEPTEAVMRIPSIIATLFTPGVEELAADAMKTFALKFGAEEAVDPIMEMIAAILGVGVAGDGDDAALATFAQLVLVLARRQDLAGHFCEIVADSECEPCRNYIAAAIVQCAPVELPGDVWSAWIALENPIAFLAAAAALIAWDGLPPQVQQMREDVVAKVGEAKTELARMSVADLVNAEFFNTKEIIEGLARLLGGTE